MMRSTETVMDIFGSKVFSKRIMEEYLPKDVCKALEKTISERSTLDPSIADVVANSMKNWALEQGATHFSHWFQPMTGLTAEKHDSFISPTRDGRAIMEFSGKNLIKGEPDASSFPSGGLRATFEARGYTAWDCTSPVFIKEDGTNVTLFIPCAFASYTGDALDKKTPLLRSMNAIDKAATRLLRLLGNTTTRRVNVTLGAEQEYFLIDKKHIDKRLDLLLTGRTLFGAPPPKGQEKGDHYYGALHERVATFMHDLNRTLWKLGVPATTQHNEVAPGQYELAPLFDSVNIATDHNQLIMETMQKIALRHDFACLLHEKPFAGVNGSGKHNNWSLATDDGINLLDPGNTPHENLIFLIILCSTIRAVDLYAPLLQASVATPGNAHRLGGHEAPPAIISIFLGDQLNRIFEQLQNGGATVSPSSGTLELGVTTLPPLPKDNTDRNRTSPFAFTGNKFEFRMVGASASTAGPMFVLNTIVADVMNEVAAELEQAEDRHEKSKEIVKRFATAHKRVVFDGDNYSEDWVHEAQRRGLPNLDSTLKALQDITAKENVALFERNNVLSIGELHARQEILLENYSLTLSIEARTMITMAKRIILPAVIRYSGEVASAVGAMQNVGADASAAAASLADLCELSKKLQDDILALEQAFARVGDKDHVIQRVTLIEEAVIPAMKRLRATVDLLEAIVDEKKWPLPSYAEMLFIK